MTKRVATNNSADWYICTRNRSEIVLRVINQNKLILNTLFPFIDQYLYTCIYLTSNTITNTHTYNVNIYEGVYVLILCFTHSYLNHYKYLFDKLLNQ